MILPKTSKPSRAQERDAYELVTLRDRGACVRCGFTGQVERDHRQNRMPGNTVASNLQLLCGPFAPNGGCHKWKSEHPADAIAEGFAVSKYEDPLVWPARRLFTGEHGIRTFGWVLYDNAGHVLEITAEEAARRMEGLVA